MMNQFSWLATGIKSLRLCTGAVGNSGQTRLFGGQPQTDQKSPPKKPLTPYFRFMAKVRGELVKANPQLKATEISQMVGDKWSRLDESSKKVYADEFKSDMATYHNILEKYNQSLTVEERDAAQQLKVDRQLRKEKREHRKRVRELEKPKKPPTAFLQYLMTKIKPGSGLEEYRNMAKIEGAKWKTLPESDKLPFVNKYKTESERYKKDLLRWEGKMLKQGNDDLVRVKQLAHATTAGSSRRPK